MSDNEVHKVVNALFCLDRSMENLKELLKVPGFPINAANSEGVTPLRAAIRSGRAQHVALLIDYGAVVDDEDLQFANGLYRHKQEVRAVLAAAMARQAAQSVLSRDSTM